MGGGYPAFIPKGKLAEWKVGVGKPILPGIYSKLSHLPLQNPEKKMAMLIFDSIKTL